MGRLLRWLRVRRQRREAEQRALQEMARVDEEKEQMPKEAYLSQLRD
jgi:hypothetical protein